MAKAKAREYVWLQCSECGNLNYRTQVRTQGGVPKLTLKRYCPQSRKHTDHKIKRR
ncbi:MAG: 50S ribosomal protein L33 [Planctomycetota bacterium]|nr:50S ribosomal protein L33 [Planctomycetota bacterium]